MPKRTRLDVLLAEQGLAESREKAQRLIRAGQVTVDGRRIDKPGTAVQPQARIELSALGPRFVSRGGEKLQGALERFGLDPKGRTCLDLGASTGGFTDCLLQAGARRVYAVDVGHGQLHERLRADPRVVLREGLNARNLDLAAVDGERIDFCTADLSFISLLKVAAAAARVLAPGAILVALVKPQFEAGRRHVRRGGRVADPAAHREALGGVVAGIAAEGFDFQDVCPSPLRGPAGNREYLAWFRRTGEGPGRSPAAGRVEAVVAEAFAEAAR